MICVLYVLGQISIETTKYFQVSIFQRRKIELVQSRDVEPVVVVADVEAVSSEGSTGSGNISSEDIGDEHVVSNVLREDIHLY